MIKHPLIKVETCTVSCRLNSVCEQSRTVYVNTYVIALYVLQVISRLAYTYCIHTDASKHVLFEIHPHASSAIIYI